MIPVFEPQIGEEEIAAVVAALRRGEISGSFGESIPHFEAEFADYCGVRHAIAVSSGTTALHVAAAAIDLAPGDEVLVSASTNIATALAVHHHGATVVPVDSEPDTWNLDLELAESLITPRTKAIIPVHLYGHPVDMDRVLDMAERHNLIVIEDAAEAHGATCRGRKTGSFGHLNCFSFYANKIITTGEGGMVTTNDDALADKVRLLRNLAFTQPRFRHELAGFNFRMTGLQAAMGREQLRKIETIIEQKRRVAATYRLYLADMPGLQLPAEMSWARNVYWMFAVVAHRELGVDRDRLITALRTDGIETRTFFCPMNQQPCLQSSRHLTRLSAGNGTRSVPATLCPVADRLWQDGLYLPSSCNLSDATIAFICERIRAAIVPQCERRAA